MSIKQFLPDSQGVSEREVPIHDTPSLELYKVLRKAAQPVFDALSPKATAAVLQLHLTHQQLAILAGIWPSHQSKVVILKASETSAQLVLALLQKIADLGASGDEWHLVSDKLTGQELDGTIITDTSLALHHFLNTPTPLHHFVIPAASIDFLIPDPTLYRQQQIELQVGERTSVSELTRQLVTRGFVRHQTSAEPGSFRVRGEQVDVYHPLMQWYSTITLYGSHIESIVQYNSAGRGQPVSRLTVPPLAFPQTFVSLADVLPPRMLFRPALFDTWQADPTIMYDALHPDTLFSLVERTGLPAKTSQSTYVLYQNRDRVIEFCRERQLPGVALCRSPLAQLPLQVASDTVCIVSERHIFPSPPTVTTKSATQRHLLIAQLTEGKPAVHDDHGIGIYEGLQTRSINGIEREYLVLRYAAGDTLSVPVELAHKVTAYLGDATPTLHRLGGTLWLATRKRARVDAHAFAEELLRTARARAAEAGQRLLVDSQLEQHLSASFPYQLTPDQAQAWMDVAEDLARARPMDRLIVGDVGFGKTEIAVRAACHVAAQGKQVAVLAPTTLLVQQHADTFRQRMPQELLPQVTMLSRFITPLEQKRVRADMASGKVRIVIGTHALLSPATTWQDLGLVIIDEEQRFGVRHKEHFKNLRAKIDILSLTATPIPRTLSMALTGLKQLSVISSPPPGRKEVQSFVGKDDDSHLTAAITREMQRGGQTYVVLPTIRGLAGTARRITSLVPKARVAVAHGQMPSPMLSAVMRQFDSGQLDVLVSSTIIENGLDLPNANTLIVLTCVRFGLAELYQLRGRIGRRERQGYAYFLYTQAKLTTLQRERLTALTQASRLGSGWSLAQRDLEIRGAGNLLGGEQSGVINAVGVQLYLDLIAEAVAKSSQQRISRHDVDIQLPIISLLPSHFIADINERTHYYQLLSRAQSIEELTSLFAKLRQHFGPLPREVENLRLILTLQHAAASLGITKILTQPITPPDEDPYVRLGIEGINLPEILKRLHTLGTWQVRSNLLTLDIDAITADFIRKLIDVCVMEQETA